VYSYPNTEAYKNTYANDDANLIALSNTFGYPHPQPNAGTNSGSDYDNH
jgi:hypothetical protein